MLTAVLAYQPVDKVAAAPRDRHRMPKNAVSGGGTGVFNRLPGGTTGAEGAHSRSPGQLIITQSGTPGSCGSNGHRSPLVSTVHPV